MRRRRMKQVLHFAQDDKIFGSVELATGAVKLRASSLNLI
jgi:hypothetical protein